MDLFYFLSFLLILFILFLISIFVYIQNYAIQKTYYKVSFNSLPNKFNKLKILHLTDIHRKSFGKNQKKLISLIRQESPDFIVVSGDIIYCYNHWYNFGYNYKKDLEKVMKIFYNIAKDYPVYYAPGNHECKSGYYPEIRKALIKSGVCVLENEIKIINKSNDEISILGLMDPTFWGGCNVVTDEYINKSSDKLQELKKQVENRFTILISHRPEIFEIYRKAGIDIVFTGHAHGGQWRFPIIGPVFAPQQGFFPKYTSGIHEFGKTKVIIGRGMGNSSMPIRLFNRPEVVITTLEK